MCVYALAPLCVCLCVTLTFVVVGIPVFLFQHCVDTSCFLFATCRGAFFAAVCEGEVMCWVGGDCTVWLRVRILEWFGFFLVDKGMRVG